MHPKIIRSEEISPRLTFDRLIPVLEQGFRDSFEGRAKNAPVMNVDLPEVNGEMHIKSGYMVDGDHICVKIATCYYDNPSTGLPTRDGLLVLASRTHGRIEAILCDSGLVTDMRTAGSSAVAVGALANPGSITLGLVGTGTQSYWHAVALQHVRSIKKIVIWGRQETRIEAACERITAATNLLTESASLDEVTKCDVVVTATPANEAVLTDQSLRPGTLLVAMGSDAIGKRELGAKIVAQASMIVVDNLEQCRRLGELQWVSERSDQRVAELGAILSGVQPGRQSDADIIIFDSTGVAFQDVIGAAQVL